MKKNYLFLGAPGSGKGTQAAVLVKSKGCITVSTGNLLRSCVEQNNEIGKKVKATIAKGFLVSDEIVNALIDDFFLKNQDNNSSIILDGYPRSLEQAKALDVILSKYKTQIDKVLYFEVSEDTIIKRITGRYTCLGCGETYNEFFLSTKVPGICDKCGSKEFNKRDDDSKEVIVNRLKVFYESTAPLLEYYKDKLVKFNAEEKEDIISKAVISHL
ncbi:MAG: nucleoside monophosphate kinase [Rickettsiales bacterium]